MKLAEHASNLSRESEASVAATNDLDERSVCETLFAPANMSSDTNRIFEEKYRDCLVRWSGTLTGVRTFTFDLVFGKGGVGRIDTGRQQKPGRNNQNYRKCAY